jgi:prevent-host-death family protein
MYGLTMRRRHRAGILSHMKRQVTATEARAKLCELLRDVEAGDEIEITRRGRPVVRLTRATGQRALKDMFAALLRATPVRTSSTAPANAGTRSEP